MLRRPISIIVTIATGLAAACDPWLGSRVEPLLKGQRISILAHEHILRPDVSTSLQVTLPQQHRNRNWPQIGGCPQHAMHHLEIADSINQVWRKTVGYSVGSRDRMLANPVVADGRVYIVDVDATVRAIDARSGTSLWKTSLLLKEEGYDTLLAGGISYDDGRLFVTTGWGEIVALRADTGTELWSRSVGAPIRTAPTVSGTRVFIINKENEIRTLAAESGAELWRHHGIAEAVTLLGSAAPAVESNTVIVALPSGELVALRAENGNKMWTDSLVTARRIGAIANLADILAPPVIDRGRVYALSYSGVLVAIDLRSGQHLWEVEIGGVNQPWIAGDFLFMLTNNSDLVAIEAQSGRIVWVRELQRRKDFGDPEKPIYWMGPVLGGNRLFVVNSHGKVISVSPYTGLPLSEDDLQTKVTLPPIVADGTIYFLVDNGTLIAYR